MTKEKQSKQRPNGSTDSQCINFCDLIERAIDDSPRNGFDYEY